MYVKFQVMRNMAVAKIDRQETLNAIDEAVLSELTAILETVESQPEIRVLVITGSGDKAFVAGGDIAVMSKLTVMESLQFVYAGHAFLNRLEKSSVVTIAAINGYALGGGTELALACDIRVASTKAVFGLPEVTIGIYPGWGGTQRLSRTVGLGKAKELILTGDRFTAKEAYDIGLVNRLTSPEELIYTCEKIAEKIASNAPVAVRQAKKVMNEGFGLPLEKGLIMEAEGWAVNAATEDRIEGLTAFLEKRTPHYKGR